MNRKSGHTVIELLVVLSAMIALLGLIFFVVVTSSSTHAAVSRLGQIREEARQGLEAIVQEVRLAGAGTVLVGTDGDSVQLRVPRYQNGAIEWSSPIEIRYEGPRPPTAKKLEREAKLAQRQRKKEGIYHLEEEEPPELGYVVRVQDGQRSILCTNVEPGGFFVIATGNNLEFQVDLLIPDTTGRVMFTSLVTSVTVRNPASGG